MKYLAAMASVSLCFGGLTVPQEAKAWGEYGHLTVCDLAYRNLTKPTRAVLADLFQVKKGGVRVPAVIDKETGKVLKPARTYTSFNVGCLEQDTRPRQNPKDHFINLARDAVSITGELCPPDQNGVPSECILRGIERDMLVLKDTAQSRQSRVEALLAVGHWVGDIHQPLHVSFADDAGGNAIRVRYRANCGQNPKSGKEKKPANLHAVWDNCLLEAGIFQAVRESKAFKASWGPRTITYRAVDELYATTTLAKERELVAGLPWQWAAESYQITLDPNTLYCVKVGEVCQYSDTLVTLPEGAKERSVLIDAGYVAKYSAVAKERVRAGGHRLADLINRALDPTYEGPLKNAVR